jgi:hypothetical protein
MFPALASKHGENLKTHQNTFIPKPSNDKGFKKNQRSEKDEIIPLHIILLGSHQAKCSMYVVCSASFSVDVASLFSHIWKCSISAIIDGSRF